MLQQLYKIFTTYEGMYVFYLIPIGYFLSIVLRSVSANLKLKKPIGIRGVAATIAICIILLDFVNYLYLFFSKTGQLIPPTMLFIKYIVGFLMWLWVFWYCYETYFSRHAAGELFSRRLTVLGWLIVGGLVLGGIGIVIS